MYTISVFRLLFFSGTVILGALVTRFLFLDATDPYRCRALLERGTWLQDYDGPYTDQMYRHWQPPGCIFHEYNSMDIQHCLSGQKLLFVGDSTVRQLFWATAKKLDRSGAENAALSAPRHADTNFTHGTAHLHFLWDPFLNTTHLHDELERFNHSSGPSGCEFEALKAMAIVVGGGLWHARHLDHDGAIDRFAESINHIAEYSKPRNIGPSLSRVVLPPTDEDSVLWAPVLLPDFEQLSPSRQATILPAKVQSMNGYLAKTANLNRLHVLWSFLLMPWHHPSAYETSGMHVVENIAMRQADVILNMRCNDVIAAQQYPLNRTCCTYRPHTNYFQLSIAISTLLLCITSLILARIRPGGNGNHRKPLAAVGVICATLLYCFAADRTWIFENTNKVTDQQTFFIIMVTVLLAGVLSYESLPRMAQKVSSPGPLSPEPISTFLSRHQTEEWKGWMQLTILAYHYTGMSSVLWAYELIRILVASYLFMIGFGHTVYFYTTNEFSLRRVAFVLIRLNMLAYLLSLIMRTSVDFYYFPGLYSFWFTIVYVTCRVRNRTAKDPISLSWKVAASALVVTILVRVPGIVENVVAVFKILFNIDVDVIDLRFRISLDLYVVYVGMLVAVLYLQLAGNISCTTTTLATHIRRHILIFKILATAAATVVLPGFFLLIRRSPDEYDYNWWQPYISCLPILSFVVLRNSLSSVRSRYSRFFAWIGRCSLETFVLQYHIWLAGDSGGRLQLGLFSRQDRNSTANRYVNWQKWVEFSIITVYFLWASWAVNAACDTLTIWLIGRTKAHSSLSGGSFARDVQSEGQQRRQRAKSHMDTLGTPDSWSALHTDALLSAEDPKEPSRSHRRWYNVFVAGEQLDDTQVKARILALFSLVWITNWLS